MHPYAFAALWPLVRMPLIASAGLNAVYYYEILSGSPVGLLLGGLIALGLIVGDFLKADLVRSSWWPCGVFCMALSLLAGFSLVAGERLGSEQDRRAAVERLAVVDRELAALPPEVESSASLREQGRRTDAQAERAAVTGCRSGVSRCEGPAYDAAKAEAAALLRRAGVAERRERLTAEREALAPAARTSDVQLETLTSFGVPLFIAANLGGLILILAIEIMCFAGPNWLAAQRVRKIVPEDPAKRADVTFDDKRLEAFRLFFEGDAEGDGQAMTQKAIAERVGVGQSTLSRWLNEEKKRREKRLWRPRIVAMK